MKTLLSHRSIRKYQNRPIEKEILDEILKAVQAAPNWVNLQHISVIVVQEQPERELDRNDRRLLPASYCHYPEVPEMLA